MSPKTLSLVLVLAPFAASALEVSLLPSTSKVVKGRSFEQKQTLQVDAALQESEGFQVLVANPGLSAITNLSLEVIPTLETGGINSSDFEVYLEYFHNITNPSPCDVFFSTQCDKYPEYNRVEGYYPDALIPLLDPYSPDKQKVFDTIDIEPDGQLVFFVDIHVPLDAEPGFHSFDIIIKSDEGNQKTVRLELYVYDVVIPLERSISTAYGFSWGAVKEYHGGPDGTNTEEIDRITSNYELELHRHRIDFTDYPFSLPITESEDGTITVDFSDFDARIGPRLDGTHFPDGVPVKRFDFNHFAPGRGQMGLTDQGYSKAARKVAEHLQAKGWLGNFYLYSSDEPWMPEHMADGSFDRIEHDAALLFADTDLWKGHVLVTGPWMERINDIVDIWCPVTPMYWDCYWPKNTWPGPTKYRELMNQGRELWFYVCNANFPGLMGYDVDAPLGYEPRLTKWGAWYEGATGFLYWRITYWQEEDPWHVLINLPEFGEQFSRQGDGILIYPGNHDGTLGTGSPDGVALDGPVLSYRLKQVRDGLEDWELLNLMSDLGAREIAREHVSKVYRKFGEPLNDSFNPDNRPWTIDENDVLYQRQQLLAHAQHFTNPSLYPDPDAPAVVEQDTTPDSNTTDVVPDDSTSVGETTDQSSMDSSAGTDTPSADAEPSAKGGSGGCSTSSADSGLSELLLLVLLAFLLLGRATKPLPRETL